jgi:hypothetical protein
MASEFKDEGEGEVYEEYEPYSPLRKKGRTDKTLLVAIAIGVGVLALVLALFSFRSGTGGEKAAQQAAELERRLDDLEFRLAEVEAFRGRIDLLESRSSVSGDIAERIERVEESVVGQMDMDKRMAGIEKAIEDRLKQLDRKMAALEKAAADRPAPAAPKKAETTAQAAAKGRYHVVAAGETLYSISRRYDTTVDRLVKLNRLDADLTIRPGQKLRVSD